MNQKATAELPRLLYVGDVPVESSYHGSALLYRLLQNYPPDRLRIIEGNLRNSLPERRLAGVPYGSVSVGWPRLLYTRLSRWAHFAYSLAAPLKVGGVRRALGEFEPEAIVTVAHEFLWLTAARYARQHSLPLHLICHDDWPRLALVPPMFRNWLGREFSRVYCQAASRLCVSPYMVEEYERRYGATGTVLYPSRAADAAQFDAPPSRLLKPGGSLTVAFAGTINSGGYVRALQDLSKVLGGMGGRLLVFGPMRDTDAHTAGLKCSNIELRGMVSSAELMLRLRAEADVLFVPMSFLPSDRENASLNFPSKLTDYTAVGLPLLIYGPADSSASRWARENPSVAEAVAEESGVELNLALIRLSQPGHRFALAEMALLKGNEYFSHRIGDKIFREVLAGNASANTRKDFSVFN